MTDEVKTEVKKEAKRNKTDQELMAVQDTNQLSTEELARYLAVMDIQSRLVDSQVKGRQLDEFKRKDQEKRDKYISNGRALEKTKRDQALQQSNCSHRKGGRGLDGLMRGGSGADYAVIRHLLPWNEWYQRCQRCGKTWKPAHKVDFDVTPEGQKAYAEAQLEYKTALSWPTDNIPSTGITFKHESADGNKTAEAFINDLTKDITLR